jgi:[FeFe] hydrogenase H-cluster maturation GTPase HydF
MSVLVERDHIGIFGKMNSGKSSVMNLLTQQETSIVDPTPGTTADTQIALQEIHGIGPVKLFDTAGLDETGKLGEKKRHKTLNDLKECDLVLLVIDPATRDIRTEQDVIEKARDLDKQILIVYNHFDPTPTAPIEEALDLLRFYKKIHIEANNVKYRAGLIDFILKNYTPKQDTTELLPFVRKDEYYVLIIPMDVETPPGRFLRPQAMVEESITRHWAYPVSFRLDLGKARGTREQAEEEKTRFQRFLNNFQKRPHTMITDSQAMDIMKDWCPPDIGLTTFSIVMINYFSRGRLHAFAAGVKALETVKSGDKVLIVEACNHSRIGEDIGTVQIPNHFAKHYPGVTIEHNFGREFQDNKQLEQYTLIIHCGGCMISAQKLQARLRDLETVGVPITNYGVLLSYLQGPATLERVLKPFSQIAAVTE